MSRNEIRDIVQSKLKSKVNTTLHYFGTLGNALGVVDIPGIYGWVWVTTIDGFEIRAYNVTTPHTLGYPVECGYDPFSNNGILQVLKTWVSPQSNTSRPVVNIVPPHHNSHQWQDPDGGRDVVYTQLRQFMPMRPTITTPMSVYIEPALQLIGSVWTQVGGQTFDMTGYVPAYTAGSGVNEQFELIGLDYTTGSCMVTSGSSIPTGSLTMAHIPATPANQFPICAVHLYSGQTVISEAQVPGTDLGDLRWGMFRGNMTTTLTSVSHDATLSGLGTTGSPLSVVKPGHTVQDAGVSKTQRTKLNFTGATIVDNPWSDSTDITITTSSGSGGSGGGSSFSWFMDGAITSGSQMGPTYGPLPINTAIGKCTAYIENAGSSGSTVVDIIVWNMATGYASGSSIWNLNPANKPALTSSAPGGTFSPDVTSSGSGQMLSLNIDSVASGATGVLTVSLANIAVSSGGFTVSGSVVDGHMVGFNGASGLFGKDIGAIPTVYSPSQVILYDQTLSGSAIFDVSGISQSYDSLRLVLSARAVANNMFNTTLTINNDSTASHYTAIYTYYGSGAGNNYATSNQGFSYVAGGNSPAGQFGYGVYDIPFYALTDRHKWINPVGPATSIRNTGGYSQVSSLCWLSTSAINRIMVTDTSGSAFAVGSRLQITGIKGVTL